MAALLRPSPLVGLLAWAWPGGRSRWGGLGSLNGEPPFVTHLGDSVHALKDQLADLHSRLQNYLDGTEVPDFELDRTSRIFWVLRLVPEPRMDCRRCDVHPEAQSGQAAFPFHPGRDPRPVRQLKSFHRPARVNLSRANH